MKRLFIALLALSALTACESGGVRDRENDDTVVFLSLAETDEIGKLDGAPLPQVVKAMQSILNKRRSAQQTASAQGLARALDKRFDITCAATCQIKEKSQ